MSNLALAVQENVQMLPIPALRKARKIILPTYQVALVPTEQRIVYKDAMVRKDNVTLRQEMHAIATNEELQNYLLDLYEKKIWEGVVVAGGVYYRAREELCVERPEKVYPHRKTGLWTFDEGPETRVFKLHWPKTDGWAAPFTNDRTGLENVYDTIGNGGHPRRVVDKREDAEKEYERIGINPKLVAFFRRRPRGKSGLSRVLRIVGGRDDGPLYVGAGRVPVNGFSDGGMRVWVGSEPKTEFSATPEKIEDARKTYERGLRDGEERGYERGHAKGLREGERQGYDKAYAEAIHDVEKVLSRGFGTILKKIRKLK